MRSDRLSRYEVRDDWHGYSFGGNSIYEHKFCVVCKDSVCSNVNHIKVELHPALRIPKRNAGKKHWKTFFEEYSRFGDSNIRSNRH